MPRFATEPAWQHGTPARTAILLVNLGTPAAPETGALRRYLKQFLSDPRVVELPRLLWWPLLNGIILNTRPAKSARKYASVWSEGGSPLKVHTEAQAALLGEALKEQGEEVDVAWAMRYGEPSIPRVLDQLKADNVTRILLLPLYPQYAAATTATAMDEACHWLLRQRRQPEWRSVRSYADHPGYIAALAASVRRHWQQHPRPESGYQLVFSFHGLPRFCLDRGDPYFCECHKTGRLLAEALALQPGDYRISFQSRFGRAEWLQPYTTATLQELARSGTQRVDVLCPGFSADCLETLEEIALEGRADFLTAGGSEYHYIPALNQDADWIAALADLARQHLQGWPTRTLPDGAELAASAARARQFGAPR